VHIADQGDVVPLGFRVVMKGELTVIGIGLMSLFLK